MTIKNALFGRGLRICYAAAFTVGTGLAIFSAAPAHAAGTLADTLVSNTVTLTYSVGGVEQTDNPESTANFEVDRKIDVQVSGETSPTATPGDTEGVLVSPPIAKTFDLSHARGCVQHTLLLDVRVVDDVLEALASATALAENAEAVRQAVLEGHG